MEADNLTPAPLSRKALQMEFALVCALTWVPLLYSAFADVQGWKRPSSVPADEIYSVFSALAAALLPIFLIWRNGESFAKFGFRSFVFRDLVVALGLVIAIAIMHLAYAPLARAMAAQPGAITTMRPRHGFPLPVESFILLASAFREEVFCRAYLCSRFRDFGLNSIQTMILSAMMFASYHIYQGWAYLPTHFIFGLIFAGVFLKYRALWPLIVAHTTYNLVLLAGAR